MDVGIEVVTSLRLLDTISLLGMGRECGFSGRTTDYTLIPEGCVGMSVIQYPEFVRDMNLHQSSLSNRVLRGKKASHACEKNLPSHRDNYTRNPARSIFGES